MSKASAMGDCFSAIGALRGRPGTRLGLAVAMCAAVAAGVATHAASASHTETHSTSADHTYVVVSATPYVTGGPGTM